MPSDLIAEDNLSKLPVKFQNSGGGMELVNEQFETEKQRV